MPDKIKSHKPPKAKDGLVAVQARDRQRKRRLNTGSAAWQTIRSAVLQREPLCRECKANGRLSVATVVDHIDGDPTNDRMDNLQSLDTACHNRKTRAEQVEKSRGTDNPKHAAQTPRARPLIRW